MYLLFVEIDSDEEAALIHDERFIRVANSWREYTVWTRLHCALIGGHRVRHRVGGMVPSYVGTLDHVLRDWLPRGFTRWSMHNSTDGRFIGLDMGDPR